MTAEVTLPAAAAIRRRRLARRLGRLLLEAVVLVIFLAGMTILWLACAG